MKCIKLLMCLIIFISVYCQQISLNQPKQIKRLDDSKQNQQNQNIYFDQNRDLQSFINQKSQLRILYTEPKILQINPPQDYILNGNFSNTTCLYSYCLYNLSNYVNQVAYWKPQPQIQTGSGRIYNVNIIGSRIMQLTGSRPTCIYQNINNLPAGFYTIWIQYKARARPYLSLNKFTVHFGNEKLVSIIPTNYQLNILELNIEIIQNNTNSLIKLCGQGNTTTAQGTVIVGVKLLRYAYHGTIQIVDASIEKNQKYVNQSLEVFSEVFTGMTTKTAISLPGSRLIFKKLFSCIVSLDHLWLYMYHQRQYGPSMDLLFDSIHEIQSEKWLFFSNTFDFEVYQNYVSTLQQNLDKKYPYQSKKFYAYQNSGQSFFMNTVEFFMSNFFLVLLIFIIGKILYKIFKKKLKISKYIKVYDYNFYFFLLLLEGNYECFSYYFAADLRTFFYLTSQMKKQNIFLVLAYFMFIIILFAGALIGLWHYSKDNWLSLQKNNFQKCTYFIVTCGFYNFFLGTLHSIIYKNSYFQLISLCVVQLIYQLFLIKIIQYKKFQLVEKRIIFAQITFSALRIGLCLLHIMDQNSQKIAKQLLNVIKGFFCIIIILIMIFMIIIQVILLIYSSISMFFRKNIKQAKINMNFIEKNFIKKNQISNIVRIQKQNNNLKEQQLKNQIVMNKLSRRIKLVQNKFKKFSQINSNYQLTLNNKQKEQKNRAQQ